MVNRPEIPHLFENDLRRFASAARPRPLAIDPWVASSLLQKAIRRGDVDLAERAALTLSRHRYRAYGDASSPSHLKMSASVPSMP